MGIQHGNERLDRKEVGYKEVKISVFSPSLVCYFFLLFVSSFIICLSSVVPMFDFYI